MSLLLKNRNKKPEPENWSRTTETKWQAKLIIDRLGLRMSVGFHEFDRDREATVSVLLADD